MIKNLPETLDLNDLLAFNCGEVDAQRDGALKSSMYISSNKAITLFKSGRYSIIVGEKGCGKSAIFRLFQDKKLDFAELENRKNIKIFLEASFDLSAYDEFVNNNIRTKRSKKENREYKYQLVWELYFLYKILSELSDFGLITTHLNKVKTSIEKVFRVDSSVNIWDFIRNIQVTIGVKSTTQNPSIIDSYATFESKPVVGNSEDKTLKEIEFDLIEYRDEIVQLLDENNLVLRVFVDKLDDFVVKENEQYQKYFLQSLLYVENSFFNNTCLRIHIFLRTDLYDKLDLTSIGADKVENRKLLVQWENKELWDFLSRRVLYIYSQVFGITNFEIDLNNQISNLNERKYPELYENRKNDKVNVILSFFNNLISKKNKNVVIHTQRTHDLREEMNKDIILSLFPEKVMHLDITNKTSSIDFLEFIVTHTSLGTGHSNPRMIMMLCNTIFEDVAVYYNDNLDKKILNDNGKFKLIPQDLFLQSYKNFRIKIQEIFQKNNYKTNDWFIKLIDIITHRNEISYSELLKGMKIDPKNTQQINEFNHFLAYFSSSGVLTPKKYLKQSNKRVYEIPILFRNLQ